jgi:hypothetical protein
VVIEAGVVAAYVVAWAIRKARRVAGRLDAEVDVAIDAGLDRLHEAVASKLGPYPVLADLDEEVAAGTGEVSELTRQQIELAVAAAARKDDAFGQAVTELVTQLRSSERATGTSVVAGAGSTIFTGDAHVTAHGGGIAVGQVGGDVHTAPVGGREQPGPSQPGR